jgi:hypothetical protein
MNEDNKPNQSEGLDRRNLVKRSIYVIPAILAAVKASERPAYAQSSGGPIPTP